MGASPSSGRNVINGPDTRMDENVEVVIPNESGNERVPDHTALYENVLTGNWESLEKIITRYPDAIKTLVTHNSGTILHLAIATSHSVKNTSLMLNLLIHVASLPNSNELFRMATDSADTALHYAAALGNLKAAEILVRTDTGLLTILNGQRFSPLHLAAKSKQIIVFKYLDQRIKYRALANPTNSNDGGMTAAYLVQNGDTLLEFPAYDGDMLATFLVYGGFCDSALEAVRKYTHLATSTLALESISHCPSYFRSSKQYKIWDRLIYSAEKQQHHDSIEYVRYVCTELQKTPGEAKQIFQCTSIIAAKNGIQEIIEEIAKVSPTAVCLENTDPEISIFHIAVKNRHHNILSLLHQTTFQRNVLLAQRTLDTVNGVPKTPNNTILHLAAILPSSDRLNRVPGAALQMQRELQWYKAVEEFEPTVLEPLTNAEGKTAKQIFTEQHKELVKEGEKWMRETANSCTIAAVLISTIAFAAAITVPGGNNGGTGSPIFSKKVAFTVFTISNAISLFSSLASLVVFLSMLTARYSEEDFLYSLPLRLIIGLFTLFVSICSLVVTSGATLYLVSSLNKSTLIFTVILGFFPVSLFGVMQFPLLVVIISSTYGPSIFRKQGNHLIF